MPTNLLPIILIVHIALAIALVLPSIVLPFALRANAASGQAKTGPAIRVLLALQAHGTVVIGLGLAASGIGLLASLGADLLSRPWLIVALVVYAGNLILAFFVQRPNLHRLLGQNGDPEIWRARARRQRYVSYTMAGLVGTIGYLMSTKPELW